MLRLIILGLLVAGVFYLTRRIGKALSTTKQNTSSQDTLVPCQHCGVHIPKKDAIQQDQFFYCSEEHRKKGSDTP